jgi:hypothetical protein
MFLINKKYLNKIFIFKYIFIYLFYSLFSFDLLIEYLSIMNVLPVLIYSNSDLNKKLIIKENKGKTGIYRWINNITGKSYIGSSINLGSRLKDYYNFSFLTNPKNQGMIIYKSLLKYGYSNFKLEILEYCNKENVIIREQYYIDLLKPEYNILKFASSSYGYKHSEKSLSKLKLHLNKLNTKKGIQVKVTDTIENKTLIYSSIRKAALAMKTDNKALYYNEKTNKLFKGRFLVKILRKTP